MKREPYINAAEGSLDNLRRYAELIDPRDLREGCLAFDRYRETLRQIADTYDWELNRVVAAFVSLSPNLDWMGNLRATLTLARDARTVHPRQIRSPGYAHTRLRAHRFLTGEGDFLSEVRGLKIRSFYENITRPTDPTPVTIDGHMVCIWVARDLGMKAAAIRPRDYPVIAQGVRDLARERGILPNQAQAALWFTRKRLRRIKYDPQPSLLSGGDNFWGTFVPIHEIRPF